MPNQATTLIVRSTGWRRLKAAIVLALMALAGCFGPPTMHYDIQEYNKQVVSSEQEMLLYNIGRLHYDQPPHFMMVSSVSQTRMFSAGLSFQWMQMWNTLFVPTGGGSGVVPKGTNTWEAGPFTAGTTENPTITFVPIQGQDFAQRFESPLTDKFSLFYEDLSWSAPREDLTELVDLFVQSLDLTHGDNHQCKRGRYFNRPFEQQDLKDDNPEPQYYLSEFSDCVDEIISRFQDVEQLDGSHKVPTEASDEPKSPDLVTALQANYKWAKIGEEYALTNPVRIPAWFDYFPNIVEQPDPKPKWDEPLQQVWTQDYLPEWRDTAYFLPKGYSWKIYQGPADQRVYALVPDGYDLVREDNGHLKRGRNGHYILRKLATHLASGKRQTGSSILTSTGGTLRAEDVGREIVGIGIPSGTKVIEVNANTATMSLSAYRDSEDSMSVGDDLESPYKDFSYTDEVVKDLWPAPYDNVYVELRENSLDNAVDDAKAKRLCFSEPDQFDKSDLVCGYFKVGNYLQIMQRLAGKACTSEKPAEIKKYCSRSIFGVGPQAPSWADNSASFTSPNGTEWAWVPAHDPQTDPPLAERDRREFFSLYKLYQMSLVDTSKLVTGAPPITISK
jgi:hypothetical protein